MSKYSHLTLSDRIANVYEQLEHIAEVLDRTKGSYVDKNNPEYQERQYYATDAVEMLRNSIIDGMLSEDVRQTAPLMRRRPRQSSPSRNTRIRRSSSRQKQRVSRSSRNRSRNMISSLKLKEKSLTSSASRKSRMFEMQRTSR